MSVITQPLGLSATHLALEALGVERLHSRAPLTTRNRWPDRQDIAFIQRLAQALFQLDVLPVDQHPMHALGQQAVGLDDLVDAGSGARSSSSTYVIQYLPDIGAVGNERVSGVRYSSSAFAPRLSLPGSLRCLAHP